MIACSIVLLAQARRSPLDHEVRERIYDQVKAHPGLHLSEIARHADVGTNHAKYHLRVLEDEDMVSSRRSDGYWRFYPLEEGDVGRKEVLPPEEKEWMSLLHREIPLRTTLLLLREERVTAGDIREALDVAASTVHYHASKMMDADLIRGYKDGRTRVYELTDPGRVENLVDQYQPSDPLVEGFLAGWEELEFP